MKSNIVLLLKSLRVLLFLSFFAVTSVDSKTVHACFQPLLLPIQGPGSELLPDRIKMICKQNFQKIKQYVINKKSLFIPSLSGKKHWSIDPDSLNTKDINTLLIHTSYRCHQAYNHHCKAITLETPTYACTATIYPRSTGNTAKVRILAYPGVSHDYRPSIAELLIKQTRICKSAPDCAKYFKRTNVSNIQCLSVYVGKPKL